MVILTIVETYGAVKWWYKEEERRSDYYERICKKKVYPFIK